MLKAGSKWKIYTRHGEIKFSINTDIELNHPDDGKLSYLNSLQKDLTQTLWYYEPYESDVKFIDAWKEIEKIEPAVSMLWIIKVQDYYCLIVDCMSSQVVNDYRMFLDDS